MNKEYTREELIEKLFTLSDAETTGEKIDTSDAAYSLFKAFGFSPVENLFMVSLDVQNRVIATHLVTKGIRNSTLIHPREIFHYAIMDRANFILIGHNHPSGIAEPSDDDIHITRVIKESGELLQIPLVDHIIVTAETYFSFSESGLMLFHEEPFVLEE